MDELQRRKLSKNETDAMFAIRYVPNSFKELESSDEEEDAEENKKTRGRKKKAITAIEEDLRELQQDYQNDIEIINAKDFDIFGGLVEDKTKIKAINNQKHREIEKDKYKVLNINTDTDVEAYKENIHGYLQLIKEALNKIQAPYDMSVYCVNNKKSIEGMHIFDINPKSAIEQELRSKKEKVQLCKINIKETTPAVFYTNIMFYDNFNKTLPLGMDLSTEVLLDTNKLNLKFAKEESFYVNYKVNEFDFNTKEIVVYEYNVEE